MNAPAPNLMSFGRYSGAAAHCAQRSRLLSRSLLCAGVLVLSAPAAMATTYVYVGEPYPAGANNVIDPDPNNVPTGTPRRRAFPAPTPVSGPRCHSPPVALCLPTCQTQQLTSGYDLGYLV